MLTLKVKLKKTVIFLFCIDMKSGILPSGTKQLAEVKYNFSLKTPNEQFRRSRRRQNNSLTFTLQQTRKETYNSYNVKFTRVRKTITAVEKQ
jgi:hypothetical protein